MARRIDPALELYRTLLEREIASFTRSVPCLFRAQAADPPWLFQDSGSRATAGYPKLSIPQIKRLPIPDLAMASSYLFLWVPSAILVDGLDVARFWGFTLKGTVVWVKRGKTGRLQIGLGHHLRNAHEIALVCTRGKISAKSPRNVPTVIEAPRTRHSQKPEEFYDAIERVIDGPYVEHFARRRRLGWTCVGDELPPYRIVRRSAG